MPSSASRNVRTKRSTLGDMMLQPGHRLSGRVVLTDGKPIPDGMRILLSANAPGTTRLTSCRLTAAFEIRRTAH